MAEADLSNTERRYPLEVAYCDQCHLVQVPEDVEASTLFVDNYHYFSSFSDALLDHSRTHAEGLIASRDLDVESLVVEIASNDGYLLKIFVEQGIPVQGIDPAPGQAEAAEKIGVPTLREFFGADLAAEMVAERGRADVIIANNVMAHVPDLNGFMAGMATLLGPDGVITVENPTVQELISRKAFDTIYHEHVCYHSCLSVDALAARHGLTLNDVEYFPDLHAGTLRWHISHKPGRSRRLEKRLAGERDAGMDSFAFYRDFAAEVADVRDSLLELLTRLRSEGATIAAYGAAAKGATLLNYVGIDRKLVDFVVDRNTHKHGLYMCGTHQPILDVTELVAQRPDYTLMLSWNFAEEIMGQQREYLEAGGRFILPVPVPTII